MEEKKHIQAYINNISFPKTLDELYWFITEHGHFNVEDILIDDITVWTAPSWTKIGDIVFFMHAGGSKSIITGLRTKLRNTKDNFTAEKYNLLMSWLEHGIELYKKYGGKIFAVGVVLGNPFYETNEDEDVFHWKSKIYADIKIVTKLKQPIPISDFNDFIKVSRQSAITPIVGNDFYGLRKCIADKNILPEILWNCDAIPLPLTKINQENWFNLTNEYRRCFLLEIQFRHFYVDYLLKGIGDQKTIFRECRCMKPDKPDTFVDNVILIGGKFLPVEVKLSILTQSDIKSQAEQYCEDTEIVLDFKKDRKIYPEKVYNENVLIIDTEKIFLYDNCKKSIEELFNLDNLTSLSVLSKIRKIIIDNLP